MSGAILPVTQYAFMVWCSVKKKHRDNFAFTFIWHNIILLLQSDSWRLILSILNAGNLWREYSFKCHLLIPWISQTLFLILYFVYCYKNELSSKILQVMLKFLDVLICLMNITIEIFLSAAFEFLLQLHNILVEFCTWQLVSFLQNYMVISKNREKTRILYGDLTFIGYVLRLRVENKARSVR
jgi:hypothetical protein